MSTQKAATRTQVMSIIGAYSGHQNVIAIPRIYINMCGDYNRAAVLNQILYWSERTKDSNGWFYKSYSEWADELGLTEYQIRRAIEGDKRSKDNSQALVNLGVETTLRKDPNGTPKVHYRIDEKVFIKHLTDTIEQCKESNLNNVKNGNQTLSIVDTEQCQDSIYTETTTETTTEIVLSATQSEPKPDEQKKDTSSNEWYDVVKEVFDLHGGRNANMQKMLQGKATDRAHKPYNLDVPMTIPELRLWSTYYRSTVLDGSATMSMVKSPEKIQSSVMGWREKKQVPQVDNRLQARKLPANLSMLQTTEEQSA